MKNKVTLKSLVDSGSHIRKNFISNVRISDEGVHPVGELWDANTTIANIVAGATEAQDTLKEVEDKLNTEVNRINGVLQQKANSVDLATVATTGNYNDLTNKPTIPNIDTLAARIAYLEKPIFNGYEYVDLGLPSGTLWATKNIGALSETEYGLYFQWGDTTGYASSLIGTGANQKLFNFNSYKYGNGSASPTESQMTKYNNSDKKITLDTSDDAASANMGGEWHLPSLSQINELFNTSYTQVSFTTVSGVRGFRITSRINNNYIFIPASGNVNGTSINQTTNAFNIWSNERYDDYTLGAYQASATSASSGLSGGMRSNGCCCRACIG